MQPEQATFLLDFLLPRIEEENTITERVLAAVPAEQRDYRPHDDARSAFELAWHITSAELSYLEGVSRGQFGSEYEHLPSHIKTIEDVIAWRRKNVPELIAELRKATGAQLCQCVAFLDGYHPAVTYLEQMIAHTAHHRGQLSAYLRAMGAKVPCIYGASADEPFRLGAR